MSRHDLGDRGPTKVIYTNNTRSHTEQSKSDFFIKLDPRLARHSRNSTKSYFPFAVKYRLEDVFFAPAVQLHPVTPPPGQSLDR
jgi:hypothetical protein